MSLLERPNLKAMTTPELVALFADIGVDKREAVEAELRERPGDQRRELLSLYGHPTMQVRFNAAMATLPVVPKEARKELEAVRASQWFPAAANAAMILEGLDDGTYTPT